MSDTCPFRQGSKLWLLETRAFQRLVCSSFDEPQGRRRLRFSFFPERCQRAEDPRSQKPETADEAFRYPWGEPATTRRLHREATRSRQRPWAPSPQCLRLYDLPRRSVKRLVVDFLHIPRKLRKTAKLPQPSTWPSGRRRAMPSPPYPWHQSPLRRTHFCRKVTSR